MPTTNSSPEQSSSVVNKAIITLLLATLTASATALLGVWKQSDLTEQRLNYIDSKHLAARTALDNKYIDKSNGVINRVDILAKSLGQHFSDDNAHQLMLQKRHLNFEHFMDKLEDAHIDIETNKHTLHLMQEGCCKQISRK